MTYENEVATAFDIVLEEIENAVNELNFDISQSKPIIDEIDRVLAKSYGFADEELDFIINYDIKYRLGDQLLKEEGEEE